MESSADRARLLIKQIGPKKLSQLSNTDHSRWLNVSKGAVRVSTDEIDVLVRAFPQYALWIASGQIAPECGQTSPSYDEANRNLTSQSAG
ncbi:DNA-binding protein [Pseudomonas aeruginosa]|nr:DNA-binding protein [Pseudomonas aeruginosa]MBK3755472.1 DNA-binding protein [Pseudomonas aeruginosa]MBK3765711.1 DNA-binding protein [Pseudomonas aeruginosa]MBK3771729.1 DNA-binding protein [Pseudomonas aeruginosa]MBK3792439.1 DNA-binding protein [Pseudomonas aeruginosa]MBK3888751.1 DNA-binding protein [Pseudomonas aeruginosa]